MSIDVTTCWTPGLVGDYKEVESHISPPFQPFLEMVAIGTELRMCYTSAPFQSLCLHTLTKTKQPPSLTMHDNMVHAHMHDTEISRCYKL